MLHPQNIGSEPDLFKSLTNIRKGTKQKPIILIQAPSNDKAFHFNFVKKGEFFKMKRNYNVFRGKESSPIYLLRKTLLNRLYA
jgi:hypothetical protein